MLDKTFKPAEIEPRIRTEWERADAFKAGRAERSDVQPYCIVIPPPNVTGSLHMGHALNNTLQDVLCRFERMRGKDVLWQVGTDHAGIATQMVVERQMMERQEPGRREIGREKFVEKVWEWKEESGSTILNQLKRLGASCDWSRERFTMDEGLSKAVLKVFVSLYNEGLIYKDKRLVNWDPKFQTAISDLEVVQVDARGSFEWQDGDAEKPFDGEALNKALTKNPSGQMYHFRYPLADGHTYQHPTAFDDDGKPTAFETRDYIVVATTRPETMLGDTGVAVHPDDARYAPLLKAGAKVRLPIVGREIPIVGDEHSDPEKGTGAVKITPAHDFNDFEVGKRHGLEQINVLDDRARINEVAPVEYRGLDRFEARKRIVADFAAQGLLEKIEPTSHTVPHGDRSGVVIEPWLTDQWYVNAEVLAKPAIAMIESGKANFVPKNWEKTYFEWMRNIQPWCISRQLWWGHQIPAWYAPDGKVFVAEDEAHAQKLADAHFDAPTPLKRDEDVLDTWFSSALWPFSTLGWPDDTTELKRYYPTNVLVTGFDIIFFWVARMMMMGMHFMEEVPFRDIYIHALVRDEKGQKMSKSKGNVMDPLVLIDTYGADALRFTLTAMAAQGRDIKLAANRVEGYRNFATKLWNAARFAEMNECVRRRDFDPTTIKEPVNRWIAGETERAVREVTEALEAYRFNEAAGAAYEFVWGVFCDWYLELIKPILAGDDERAVAETRATVAWTLDQILKLLHPFMPYITEELWAHAVEHGERRESVLALSRWPTFSGLIDAEVDEEIGWVVRLISEIRSLRTEMNVPAGAKLPLVLPGASAELVARAKRHEETISRLARLDGISFPDAAPKGAAVIVAGDTTAALPLGGVIDTAAELKRLGREIEKAESDLGKMDAKLSNPQFVAKAKEEAIEEARERKAELEDAIQRLQAAIRRLEQVG
ncbi:valine--tRNA ligase [Hyphomicrobium sulfonivorans]|uniref:valine--tRNA ligase n=1 Tax=Hyphomicrobium sulfonivorans TaxID=121290 RepID=UPI00156F1F6A|nr:valine--tRNA ligase [Hyphomicrobium sulfonivorans]MBI1651090.1 valine--tRNA ligase [Hyphomicrobium sulfonivorans]NSL72527.1 valine--tRNA ligase [Hyphomicrobium sulfonivorans]